MEIPKYEPKKQYLRKRRNINPKTVSAKAQKWKFKSIKYKT